jgi:hypothetical protein
MNKQKISYLAKATALVMLFCNAPLFAETVFVVGSYNNSAKANEVRKELATKLDVPVHITTATVASSLVHRIYIRNDHFFEVTAAVLQGLRIEPWRLNVDFPLPLTASDTSAPMATEVLVASFTSIDAALALERKLANEGLDFTGEAQLVNGSILHQIWVHQDSRKSLTPEQTQSRLNRLGLAQLAVRAVAVQPDRVERPAASTVAAGKSRAAAQDLPAGAKKPGASANRYPKNFNLARLPEKKPQ